MPRKPTSPGSLVTRKEIAQMIGRSRQRVYQITDDPSFPKPVDVLHNGELPVWKRAAVERHLAPADQK